MFNALPHSLALFTDLLCFDTLTTAIPGESSDPFRRALVLGDGDAMQTLEERLKQLFLVLQQHFKGSAFQTLACDALN